LSFGFLLETIAKYPRLAMDLLSSICSHVVNHNTIAYLSEYCIEVHFTVSPDWTIVQKSLKVPQLDEKGFLLYCQSIDALLCLYTYILQKLQKPNLPKDQQYQLLDTLIVWTKDMNLNHPKVQIKHQKILLFWVKMVIMFCDYLYQFPNDRVRLNQLAELKDTILKYGGDKSGSGLLGALGIGEKSPYPVQFRLCARALGTFLAIQFKENNTIRVRPQEPINMSKQCEKLLSTLSSLSKSNEYQPFTSTIQATMSFITDPNNTLAVTANLVFLITSRVYPGCNYFTTLSATHSLE